MKRRNVSLLSLASMLACFLSSTAVADPATEEIHVKGKEEFKLKHEGDEWKLHGPGDVKRVIRAEAGGWALVGEDRKTLMRAKKSTDGAVHVTNGAGAATHDLKPGGDGFELHGSDGALLWRVKVKADKFNVYDAAGKRAFHGKRKDDGISIHDDGDAQLWKIKGIAELAPAAPFGLPVDMGEVALLYVARR